MKKLKISSSIFDIYLLFNDNIIVIINLQTNNSLIANIIEFINLNLRELYVAELVTRLYKKLTSKQFLKFNKFVITLEDSIRIS